MASDGCMLSWVNETFGPEGLKGEIPEWIQEDLQVGDDALRRDVLEVADLLVVLGWLERRMFSHQLAEHDLTIPQFFTLLTILHSEESCTMGVLAEQTHQCSATMTGIVDRLIKMDLVERSRAEADRRMVLVHLTEQGELILQEALRSRLEGLKKFLLEFDEKSRRQFIQALRMSISLIQTELGEQVPGQSVEEPEVTSG